MARFAMANVRTTLEQMARTWDQLAADREARIRRADNEKKRPH